MKKTVLLGSLALAGLFASCNKATDAAQTDYTQYVDVFIGAADNGHVPILPQTPFPCRLSYN